MVLMRRALSNVSGISILLAIMAACVVIVSIPRQGWSKDPIVVKISNGQAKVTYLTGTATVRHEGEWQVRPLEVDSIVYKGDQVRTGASARLEILLPDGSFMRFAERTDITIQDIDCSKDEKKRNVRVNLGLGRAWASIKKIFFGLKPKTEIVTTNAVCGVRGTVFRMNVNDDQSALVRTYEGEVSVSKGEGKKPEEQRRITVTPVKIPGPVPVPGPHPVSMEEWTYIVKSMQQIRVSSDGMATKPEAFTAEEDRNDWVDWNREREEAVRDIEVFLDEDNRQSEPEDQAGKND